LVDPRTGTSKTHAKKGKKLSGKKNITSPFQCVALGKAVAWSKGRKKESKEGNEPGSPWRARRKEGRS